MFLALGSANLAVGAPTSAEAPTIYRWVDTDGVAHFTTDLSRVPRSLRKQVSTLSPAPETLDARKNLPGKSRPGGAGESEFAERNVDFGESDGSLSSDDDFGTGDESTSTQTTPNRVISSADRARIAEIEQQIAQDEETIKNWLTATDNDGTPTQFEAAARRLPKLQRELVGLRQPRNGTK